MDHMNESASQLSGKLQAMRQLMNGSSFAISEEKKRANTEDTNKINQLLILLSYKLINYCCTAYPSSVFMVVSIWLSKQTTPLCGWVEALPFTEASEQEGIWRDRRWVQPQLCCLLPLINCSEQLANYLPYVVHG